MSEASEADLARAVDSLPPSAWMTAGIPRPRNRVAILGKKGGTGKTSLTSLLIDACLRFGLNPLGIDGDPQGSLSLGLDSLVNLVPSGKTTLNGRAILVPDRHTMVEVLEADADGVVDEAARLIPWEYDRTAPFINGGPLIPGKIGVGAIVPAHNPLEDVPKGWNVKDVDRFARAIGEPLEPGDPTPHSRFDIVFGDLLPGGSDLARAFLKGMDFYLLLATAEPFGMASIANTIKFANEVRDSWNHPTLKPLGMVFSSYNPRLKVTRDEMAELRAAYAKDPAIAMEILEIYLSSRTLIPKSQGYRAPVSAFLDQRADRHAAKELCQIAEALLLTILDKIGHPAAADLRTRWLAAWGGEAKITDLATGKIAKKEAP